MDTSEDLEKEGRGEAEKKGGGVKEEEEQAAVEEEEEEEEEGLFSRTFLNIFTWVELGEGYKVIERTGSFQSVGVFLE